MGVVLACDAESESAKLKFLFDVAPASACLTPELLRLVHFLKERTFCTYYEAVKAVIPYGAQYKPTVAEDGVTPVLQKQLVRHTENAYKLVGTLPPKPRPTAKQLAAVALLAGESAPCLHWRKRASAGRCWTTSAPRACWNAAK